MKAGRPRIYEAESTAMKVFSVRLNVLHEKAALKLGKGNMSVGIRLALENVLQKKENAV
ncbi:hypothetical protein HOT57_gp70 [Pseudomonas phage phCDa]|uniref:Uncharacterized protein n=1 Tax=Pseudomonas phage phCDa TaxID=2268587 RepID=A0A2Z5H964_9CAUD|nr:hypothetical protein HOT57_gp70 [Pseudomonas phage phCDa]AXC36514.1 hypothetical protein phCDa_70 [Pseudomonas phage phCDa]